MHKQVSGWTVNFCPNIPESPFLEFQTRKPPPPPHFRKLQIEMTKVYSGIAPLPISENFRFEMIKVYSGIPPHFRKTSDLRWPKFTLEYPPPPPFWKTSDLRWPKFTPEYPPPPFWKTSDLRWPKFTPEYHPPAPISENAWDHMWRLICNPQGYHSFTALAQSCSRYLQYKQVCPDISLAAADWAVWWNHSCYRILRTEWNHWREKERCATSDWERVQTSDALCNIQRSLLPRKATGKIWKWMVVIQHKSRRQGTRFFFEINKTWKLSHEVYLNVKHRP